MTKGRLPAFSYHEDKLCDFNVVCLGAGIKGGGMAHAVLAAYTWSDCNLSDRWLVWLTQIKEGGRGQKRGTGKSTFFRVNYLLHTCKSDI